MRPRRPITESFAEARAYWAALPGCIREASRASNAASAAARQSHVAPHLDSLVEILRPFGYDPEVNWIPEYVRAAIREGRLDEVWPGFPTPTAASVNDVLTDVARALANLYRDYPLRAASTNRKEIARLHGLIESLLPAPPADPDREFTTAEVLRGIDWNNHPRCRHCGDIIVGSVHAHVASCWTPGEPPTEGTAHA